MILWACTLWAKSIKMSSLFSFQKYKLYQWLPLIYQRKLLLPFFMKGCNVLLEKKMDYQVLNLSIDHISAGKYDSQFPFLRDGFLPSHIPQEKKKYIEEIKKFYRLHQVSLPDFHCWHFHCQIFIVMVSLPGFHCQVFIARFSLPNFHCQIFIARFSLPNLT